jgi:hypothetical protein
LAGDRLDQTYAQFSHDALQRSQSTLQHAYALQQLGGILPKLINTLTGTENDSMSSRSGVLVLAGVLPGTYTLQVERGGFATIQVTGLVLNVGDNRNFLVRMKVRSVAEIVTVYAAGVPLI